MADWTQARQEAAEQAERSAADRFAAQLMPPNSLGVVTSGCPPYDMDHHDLLAAHREAVELLNEAAEALHPDTSACVNIDAFLARYRSKQS